MELTLEIIANRIRHAKSVAIFTHMRPDGDALGSALAISRALDFLQVENQVCVETEIPSKLAFLQGIDKVQKYPIKSYDMLVCVDCSDVQRLGALSDEWLTANRRGIETVNIDHHVIQQLDAVFAGIGLDLSSDRIEKRIVELEAVTVIAALISRKKTVNDGAETCTEFGM